VSLLLTVIARRRRISGPPDPFSVFTAFPHIDLRTRTTGAAVQ